MSATVCPPLRWGFAKQHALSAKTEHVLRAHLGGISRERWRHQQADYYFERVETGTGTGTGSGIGIGTETGTGTGTVTGTAFTQIAGSP